MITNRRINVVSERKVNYSYASLPTYIVTMKHVSLGSVFKYCKRLKNQ